MTKLGIIGGAGPYASALFYQTVIEQAYRSARQVPEMCILNFPFTRGLTCQESQQHALLIEQEMQYCINVLASYGASRAAIACNTLHVFLDQIDLKGMQLVRLPLTVRQSIRTSGVSRVLLLSTQTTQACCLYQDPAYTLIQLEKDEQVCLDRILDHILQGHLFAQDAHTLIAMLMQIKKGKLFEGIVLGCTELSVLHHHFPLSVPDTIIFDPLRLTAEQLIQ